ncbi:MAG: hypothetical protein HYU66_03535 [Armatimonadetes bacterium]|nr:hypothetical protein [Armatimonadota bacterium]
MLERSSVPRGVTWRSLTVGTVLTIVLGWGAPYVMHVLHASYLALDFSTPGATALLFLLVAVANPLVGLVRRSWRLEPGEILVVYAMLVLASAVVEMGLASQLLPIIATPAYYATDENHWHELFMNRLPNGVVLHDVAAATRFFEGAPRAAIDWHSWFPVLLVWSPFLIALYAVMIALMVIVRAQWDDRERLAYPLTQVPLALVDQRERLLGNPLLWLGFGVPFLISTVNGLHHYFPALPALKLDGSAPVFGQYGSLIFRLSFPMLGFFFLVNQDAVFSLWLFNLLFWLAKAGMLRLGLEFTVNLGIYGTPFALYKYIGWGAIIALVAGTTYTARQHLGGVLCNAFTRRPALDDRGEAMSYRSAVLTVLVGCVVMALWLNWTGLGFGVAWYFLLMAFLFFFALTRVVVESGLAEAVVPLIAPGAVVATFGSGVLSAAGHAGLTLTYVYSSDIRTYVMASSATALKLFHSGGMKGRKLFWVMALAVLVGAASSLWATLAMAYRYGGATMNNWFFVAGPKLPFDWLEKLLSQRVEVNHFGMTMVAFGAVVMAALMWARQTFWWWPLHPVGWCIGSVWIMDQLWLTAFLAWFTKSLIVRHGGLKLYRRLRPVALGMVLGQFTANVVWAVIDHLVGGSGNAIFWI